MAAVISTLHHMYSSDFTVKDFSTCVIYIYKMENQFHNAERIYDSCKCVMIRVNKKKPRSDHLMT